MLKGRRDLVGAIPGTFEAWLALRGLRTLPLRVEKAQANAQELVRRLRERADLTEVRYPGFGAMIAIVLPHGGLADLVQHSTKLWVYATSLGGVESTLERRRRWKTEPATIPEGLIRLSVGIEDVEDLWEDLEPGARLPRPDPLTRVVSLTGATRTQRSHARRVRAPALHPPEPGLGQVRAQPRVAAVTRRVVVPAQWPARLGTHPGGIPDEASHTHHHDRGGPARPQRSSAPTSSATHRPGTHPADARARPPPRARSADTGIERRVDRLLAKMTIKEKLQQVQLLSDGQITTPTPRPASVGSSR